MAYSPLTSRRWQRLAALAQQAGGLSIAALCRQPARLAGYSREVDGLYADYTRHLVTDEILGELKGLADEAGVLQLLAAMAAGEHVNVSEDRPALHMAQRAPADSLAPALRQRLEAQQRKLAKLTAAVRKGNWLEGSDWGLTDIINIGIGGSDLGPRMACAALRPYAKPPLKLHFIANVDGAEIRHLLKRLAPVSTLVIISSKSFATAETRRNADTALAWLGRHLRLGGPPAASRHVIGVTANPEAALAYGIKEEQLLTFEEGLGGRHSLWSAIGLPIAIAFGFDRYQELLAGAAAMDRHFQEAGLDSLPVTLALLGVWNSNFLGHRTQAVVPYCERLGLLVPYLQQLHMESNGKSTRRDGQPVGVDTAPVLWGQTGTNGQHAFFQALHQGTQTVPVDFIGLRQDDASIPEHHQQLIANMIAQADALMAGRPEQPGHRHYPGNRPSTLLLLEQLTPRNLGLLLALYEHVVFVQAALWGINPFDQWGVELGKELASQMLAGDAADATPGTRELLRRLQLQ